MKLNNPLSRTDYTSRSYLCVGSNRRPSLDYILPTGHYAVPAPSPSAPNPRRGPKGLAAAIERGYFSIRKSPGELGLIYDKRDTATCTSFGFTIEIPVHHRPLHRKWGKISVSPGCELGSAAIPPLMRSPYMRKATTGTSLLSSIHVAHTK